MMILHGRSCVARPNLLRRKGLGTSLYALHSSTTFSVTLLQTYRTWQTTWSVMNIINTNMNLINKSMNLIKKQSHSWTNSSIAYPQPSFVVCWVWLCGNIRETICLSTFISRMMTVYLLHCYVWHQVIHYDLSILYYHLRYLYTKEQLSASVKDVLPYYSTYYII